MNDEGKTREQLLTELAELQQRIKIIKDIEAQHSRVEKALRETNEFLRNILESSSDISIISTDLQQNIIYWNSGAENIFGYKAEEVVGKEKIDVLYDPEDKEANEPLEGVRNALFVEKRGISCELREVTKNGRKLWINMTLTPRLSDNDEVIGILGVGEDITERKRAEEELQETMIKLRRSLEGVIQVMVTTVEARDTYTAGHQRRVADLSVAIAKEMGLPEEQIEGIRMAGIIHDLGKIAIPAEILSNPGRLSDIQFSMIKTHPQVGYDILKTIDFPWPIAKIVLQHHERLNGSGYPQGLTDKNILIEAKILSVADVVEAIASHRPYRAALGPNVAFEEIQKNRGTFFDPDAVDACIRLFKEKGYQLEKL